MYILTFLLYILIGLLGELRPIELAAHAHYYLAWIHPFEDGNGRISRLLLNLILIRNGYPFAVIKNVDRKKYLETLRRADLGEFGPFLNYVARCAEQTLDLYLLEIQGKKGKKAKLLPLNELAKGTPYSSEYLSLLARKGVIDAKWEEFGKQREELLLHTLDSTNKGGREMAF